MARTVVIDWVSPDAGPDLHDTAPRAACEPDLLRRREPRRQLGELAARPEEQATGRTQAVRQRREDGQIELQRPRGHPIDGDWQPGRQRERDSSIEAAAG